MQQFSEVIRGYDRTLDKSEREAAISDLEQEKKRQKAQVKEAKAAPRTN